MVTWDTLIGVVAHYWRDNDGGRVEGRHGGEEDVEVLALEGGQLLDVLHPRDRCQDWGDVEAVSVASSHHSSPREARQQ